MSGDVEMLTVKESGIDPFWKTLAYGDREYCVPHYIAQGVESALATIAGLREERDDLFHTVREVRSCFPERDPCRSLAWHIGELGEKVIALREENERLEKKTAYLKRACRALEGPGDAREEQTSPLNATLRAALDERDRVIAAAREELVFGGGDYAAIATRAHLILEGTALTPPAVPESKETQ